MTYYYECRYLLIQEKPPGIIFFLRKKQSFRSYITSIMIISSAVFFKNEKRVLNSRKKFNDGAITQRLCNNDTNGLPHYKFTQRKLFE